MRQHFRIAISAVLLVPGSLHATEIDLATSPADWTVWAARADATGESTLIADLNGDGVQDLAFAEGRRYMDPPPPIGTQREARWCIYFGPIRFPEQHDLLAETPPTCIHHLGGDAHHEQLMRTADLDGDGMNDLILGVRSSLDLLYQTQGLIAVFRGRSAWPSDLDYLSDADWIFQGAGINDGLDRPVLGDITGDGCIDLGMFAPGASGPLDTRLGAGEGYFFFGPPSRWSKRVYDLAVDPPDLHIIGAARGGALGWEAVIGDLIGDGIQDLIVSAPAEGLSVGADAGAVFVLRGRDLWPSEIDLATPGTADLVVLGPASQSWLSAVTVIDWDGDGLRDLVVGAPQWTLSSPTRVGQGGVFVLLGRSALSGVWDLATRAADVTFVGHRSHAWLGWNVEAGDLNGDGFADLVVTAKRDPTPLMSAAGVGAVYVLYGCENRTPFVDLAVDPPRLAIYGADGVGPTNQNGDEFGYSLSVGDVDGDGRSDIFAGAPWSESVNNTREWGGEAHVILGPPSIYLPVCTVAPDAGPGADVCAGSPVTLDGSATTVTGCSKTPQYRWLVGTTVVRDWALDPTEVVNPLVDSTYRLEIRCGDCAGPCFGTASVAVTTRPDPIPPDQGNALRAVRRNQDAVLTFPGAPATNWRMFRDDSKLALGMTQILPDVAVEIYEDLGIVPLPPTLQYYRVKGLSPCSFTPGP